MLLRMLSFVLRRVQRSELFALFSAYYYQLSFVDNFADPVTVHANE